MSCDYYLDSILISPDCLYMAMTQKTLLGKAMTRKTLLGKFIHR